MKKLTPMQAELLAAMQRGVVVHYMQGRDPYYFRDDNLQRCTRAAMGVMDRKLIRPEGTWYRKTVVLTEAGRAYQASAEGKA